MPGFEGTESVLLAVGILGATVMPHVIYLHSALTQHRIVGATEEEKRRIYRFELIDVLIAMGIAGLINMSMLDHRRRGVQRPGPDRDRRRPRPTSPTRSGSSSGAAASILFGVALLASGLSSSSVGTMAGQVVMQGFIDRQIPLFVRRAVTMVPALVDDRDRGRPDALARAQPGRALVRDPLRADPAAHVLRRIAH